MTSHQDNIPLTDRSATTSTQWDSSDSTSQQAAEMNPEAYARRVRAFSIQSTVDSIYAGLHYADLAKYLVSPYLSPYTSHSGQAAAARSSTDSSDFVVICDLSLCDKDRTKRVKSPQEFDEHLKASSTQTTGSIVFMRGFCSPACLNHIGANFVLDPEFYFRHLDILSPSRFGVQDYTCIPQLPSVEGILQFRYVTLGTWDTSRSSQSLSELREICATSLMDYQDDFRLRQNAPLAHPIVRQFFVHDRKNFFIEQNITITVVGFQQRWYALVWLDAGSELHRTDKGPWIEAKRTLSWATSMHPIFQHRNRIALKTRKEKNRKDPAPEVANQSSLSESCQQLPFDYGRFLHPEIAEKDAFYALYDVFAFVASSKSQFLNLMERSITNLSRTGSEENIAELQLIKSHIETHLQSLREEKNSIKHRTFLKWPSVGSAARRSDVTGAIALEATEKFEQRAEEAAEILQRDFEYLTHRATTLSERCADTIGVMLNQSQYQQTKRTIGQAEKLGKLTMLAFIFVPLSFSCSFFGMNFVEITERNLRIWIWFAASGILLILCYSAFFMPVPSVARLKRGRPS